jgi:hypothetical protein
LGLKDGRLRRSEGLTPGSAGRPGPRSQRRKKSNTLRCEATTIYNSRWKYHGSRLIVADSVVGQGLPEASDGLIAHYLGSSRERQQRPGLVTPRRNFCESARATAGVGASGGMRANDCLTDEVERRPSAEHAGCGATVHAVWSSLGTHMQAAKHSTMY